MRVAAVVLALLAFSALAEAPDEPEAVFTDGPLNLKDGYRNAFKIDLGKRIKATAKLYETDFFDAAIVNGQLEVENATKDKVSLGYHLALFDAKGNLLGCSSQSIDLDPGEKTMLGSIMIRMPHAVRERVTNYRIAYYEDAQPIGKR